MGARPLVALLVSALAACAPAAPPERPEPSAPSPSEPSPSEPAEPSEWREGAPAPLALTEVAAAPLGGQVWVVGGLDASGAAVSTAQVYDPTFDSWSPGPDLPEAVHHAALVGTGSDLWLVGGYAGSGFDMPTPAVHRLDPATGGWVSGPALPEARAAGAAAWDGSRVVYAGGVGPGGLSGTVFALEAGSWAELGDLSEPREHLAAASDGAGRVWFLGGRTGGLDTNLTTVDVVEGATVTPAGDLPTARGGLAGFWHPAAGACAVGGEAPEGTFADVECVDAEGSATALSPIGGPRHGLGAVASEGFAYVLLGGSEPGLSVSDAVESLALE